MLPSYLFFKVNICLVICKETADEEYQYIRLSLLGHSLQELLLEYSIKYSYHIYYHYCDLLVLKEGCFNIMGEESY